MFSNINKKAYDTYTFTLENSHVTWANTLRRIMLTGVETVAFRTSAEGRGTGEIASDVTVQKNDTPMTNQTLAHRVGLLPLHISEPLKWISDNYTFQLNVTNTTDKNIDVVAGDFEVYKKGADGEDVRIDSTEIFKPNPITRDTSLIAVLKPRSIGSKSTTGESIQLTAKATIGTGREHAAFIPVSRCSYVYTRDNNAERIKQQFEKWLVNHKKIVPAVLDEPENEAKKGAYEREFNSMEISRVYKINDSGNPVSFDFTVRTVGVLEVPYIVRRACEIAEAMCSRYINVDSGPLPDEVTMSPADSRVIGFDIIFRGHDHTLGNMLQTWLVENHVDGTMEPRITYAGYKVPHPLRDEMLLRIGVEDGKQATALAALAAAAKGCVQLWRNYKRAWNDATGTAMPVIAPPPSKPRTLRIVKTPKA
jgi:DNA-directed RNA polymerase subunit L